MAAQIERIDGTVASGEARYLLELPKPDELPETISLSSEKFVCLVAWDSLRVDPQEIGAFASRLLNMGAVSISTWGPGCERLHDIFDEESAEAAGYREKGPVIMTTWHSDEHLEEAIWYVMFSARPDEAYDAECQSVLAVVIGEPDWAADVRHAFADPRRFSDKMLARL